MKCLAWLTPIVIASLTTVAQAQESGDPKAGLAYGQQVCAKCHAVLANE